MWWKTRADQKRKTKNNRRNFVRERVTICRAIPVGVVKSVRIERRLKAHQRICAAARHDSNPFFRLKLFDDLFENSIATRFREPPRP